MLISTEIGSFRKKLFSDKEIISLLKNADFNAYDFTMTGEYGLNLLSNDNCFGFALDLKKHADEIGIVCNQAHAPFPTAKINDDEYNANIFPILSRSIKVAGILGAKIIVIHPCNYFSPEQNVEFYKKLLPIAKEAGIKIATENMWNYDRENKVMYSAANSDQVSYKKLMDLLNALDKQVFVSCVDIGHAELDGLNTSAVQLIETLGKNVQCIHLHDIDKIKDLHYLPFTSGIDYMPIIDALKNIDYDGDITLECTYFMSRHLPPELVPSFMRLYVDVANWFKSQFEKK